MSPHLTILSRFAGAGALLCGFAGCETGCAPAGTPPVVVGTSPALSLEMARKGFVTKLKVRGPAPEVYKKNQLPAALKEVEYTSGGLKLKGWISPDAGDGAKLPAVVYLHDGWALDSREWRDAKPFVKAGFVLFMPALRGENGNPGVYESFLGEVDDAIAAGWFVASLANVDRDNVFVVGHGVGAILACLSAMLPSPYKSAAALDAHVEMDSWVSQAQDEQVPFDRHDLSEIRVRNPVAFASSIRCPLRLYTSTDYTGVPGLLYSPAQKAGKNCELVVVPADHEHMVEPGVQMAMAWFWQQWGK